MTTTPTLVELAEILRRRRGWHDRRPGHAVPEILLVLCRRADPATGHVTASIQQVAHEAIYSVRWTHACLGELERLGIITWRRGGIIAGGIAQRSAFTIHRDRLATLAEADAAPGGTR